MIKVRKLSKKYGKRTILDEISVDFENKGFVFVHGTSGCGKTTFFNALAGLIDFEGTVEFDNKKMEKMDENEKSKFRLENISFIFQDYKLFEKMSVEENLTLVISSSMNLDSKARNKRIEDVLQLVGLIDKKKQTIDTLSGGEKQRVAIARAIAGAPKLILCDEPTGSLDESNANNIVEILHSLSKNFLVIVISHDYALMSQYASKIMRLENGKLDNIVNESEIVKAPTLRTGKLIANRTKPTMPLNFAFKYASSIVKKTKVRTIFQNIFLTFAFLGIGISFLAKGLVENVINNFYGTLVDESRLFIESPYVEVKNKQKSTPTVEVKKIAEKHGEIIYDYGVCYHSNFEYFFKDKNDFFIVSKNNNVLLPKYSLRDVNDFEWLDFCNKPIYPQKIDLLKDDEIILELKEEDITYLTERLSINSSIFSFSDYLKNNHVSVCLETQNDEWQYSDQHLLTLKGFVIGSETKIYHSNHLWNEYIFEEEFRFPFAYSIDENSLPWTMKKINYLKVSSSLEAALRTLRFDHDNARKIFELASEEFYPNSSEKELKSIRPKLLVFDNPVNLIDLSHISLIEGKVPQSSIIYGTPGGYSFFPGAFLEGFAKPIFFSASSSLLDNLIDTYTFIEMGNKDFLNLPRGIVSGHYSKSLQDGVIFNSKTPSFLEGKRAESLEEIVISQKMAISIFGSNECVGKILHFASAVKERRYGDKMERVFYSNKLTITGVSTEIDKNVIYHNPEWSFLFFQCCLGISAFELCVDSLSFDFSSGKDVQKAMNFLERNFKEYNCVYPYDVLTQSVGQVSSFILTLTVSLSVIATLISFALVMTLDYLFVLENKRAIGLTRCIGLNSKEANKLLVVYSFSLTSLAFLSSSLSLVLLSYVFGLNSFELFTIAEAIMMMFVMNIFLGILPPILTLKRFGKMNVLDLLKNK